jgi:hypothetical protein
MNMEEKDIDFKFEPITEKIIGNDFDVHGLANLNFLYDEEQLYTPWFSSTNNDFAFSIHKGKFANIWILIESYSIKMVDEKLFVPYKVIRNINKIPKEDFEKKEFIKLLTKMMSETLDKMNKHFEKHPPIPSEII